MNFGKKEEEKKYKKIKEKQVIEVSKIKEKEKTSYSRSWKP